MSELIEKAKEEMSDTLENVTELFRTSKESVLGSTNIVNNTISASREGSEKVFGVIDGKLAMISKLLENEELSFDERMALLNEATPLVQDAKELHDNDNMFLEKLAKLGLVGIVSVIAIGATVVSKGKINFNLDSLKALNV